MTQGRPRRLKFFYKQEVGKGHGGVCPGKAPQDPAQLHILLVK